MEENKNNSIEQGRQNVNPYSAQANTYRSPVEKDETMQNTANVQSQSAPYAQPVNGQPQGVPYAQPVNGQPQGTPYAQPVNGQPQGTSYAQPVNGQPQGVPYAQPVNGQPQGVPYGQRTPAYPVQPNGAYGQQGYAPIPVKKKSQISIAAMVLAFFAPVVGLILGIVSKVNAKKKPNEDHSLALPAIIISAIFIVLHILGAFAVIKTVKTISKNAVNGLEKEYISAFSGLLDEYTTGRKTTASAASHSASSVEKTYDRLSVKLGDTLSTNNTKLIYKSCKYVDTLPKNNSSYVIPEGKKIIRIEHTFENKSGEKMTLGGLYCYADNISCKRVSGYEDEKRSSAHLSVGAGESFTVVEYFEVPANAKTIQFKKTVTHSKGTERITLLVK